MNPDFVDLLRALRDADARHLIVGAYALAHYGRPRATGDLDVWVEATATNAPRIMRALTTFGAPLTDINERDFAQPGNYSRMMGRARSDRANREDAHGSSMSPRGTTG